MSAGRPFRGCACFFTDNIFVGRFGLHVRYRDEPQLRRDHGRALRERGCRSEEQFREVLREALQGHSEVTPKLLLSRQSRSIPRLIPLPLGFFLSPFSGIPGPLSGIPAPLSGIPGPSAFPHPGVNPEGSLGFAGAPSTGPSSRHRVRIRSGAGASRGKNSPRAPISEEFIRATPCN